MIVNTASECGFTPQYAALQELHTHFADRHFEVIGFPSNDFGAQEPGSDADIQTFCQVNYGVTFPLMAKSPVLGVQANPVFKWFADADQNGVQSAIPEWNFAKFLVDEEGQFVRRLAASEHPASEFVLNWLNAENAAQ